MDKGRLLVLAELHRKGKRAEVRTALKAANPPTPPAPKFPVGASPPPTSPDGPFSATAVAMFIVSANERRLRGCPPVAPSSPVAAFIVKQNERRLGRAQ